LTGPADIRTPKGRAGTRRQRGRSDSLSDRQTKGSQDEVQASACGDDSDRHGDRHRHRLHDLLQFPDKKTAAQIAGYISIMSDIFLRLIKMLIGPLVFSTLVVGIAHMGDAASVDACS
jgi:hypothetical protein